MKAIKIIFALLVITLGMNIQDANAQRIFTQQQSCNCDRMEQQNIRNLVLRTIPRRFHNNINFSQLFRTGKTTVSPRPTASTTLVNPNGGGLEKKECSSSSSTTTGSNGQKTKCTTVICHYTSIDEWSVNSFCLKIK